jgi:hypothetical protein
MPGLPLLDYSLLLALSETLEGPEEECLMGLNKLRKI